MRERIDDIAAEVAKLAMTLEGPNSAIEAMLAAEPVIPAKAAARPASAANGTVPEGGGTLAERIRALQSTLPARASRGPEPIASGDLILIA